MDACQEHLLFTLYRTWLDEDKRMGKVLWTEGEPDKIRYPGVLKLRRECVHYRHANTLWIWTLIGIYKSMEWVLMESSREESCRWLKKRWMTFCAWLIATGYVLVWGEMRTKCYDQKIARKSGWKILRRCRGPWGNDQKIGCQNVLIVSSKVESRVTRVNPYIIVRVVVF